MAEVSVIMNYETQRSLPSYLPEGGCVNQLQEHSPQEHSKNVMRLPSKNSTLRYLVKQKEVPIYQFTLPLPRTPQGNDSQQLLPGSARGGNGQLYRENNRLNAPTVRVTLIRRKGSQFYLRGRAMTSPGRRGHQPALSVTGTPSTSTRALSNGHTSPRQLDKKQTAMTPRELNDITTEDSSSPRRDVKTAMSTKSGSTRSDVNRSIQLPSIMYGSETKSSHSEYMLNSNRYLDSYATAHNGLEVNEVSDLDLGTLRLKRKRTTQRKDTYSPRPDTSHRKLGQCLLINPTKCSTPTRSENEDFKMKHHNTFIPQSSKREKKRIQNGLYASVPNKSSISEPNSSTTSAHTYKFTSIDSYLKYNEYGKQESSRTKTPIRVPVLMDINASVIGQGSAGTTNHRPEKRTRSKHQKEAVSRMPSAKYSDIAALGDLDEFFVVTTPHIDQKSSKSLKSGKSTKSTVSNAVADETNDKLSEEWKGKDTKSTAKQ